MKLLIKRLKSVHGWRTTLGCTRIIVINEHWVSSSLTNRLKRTWFLNLSGLRVRKRQITRWKGYFSIIWPISGQISACIHVKVTCSNRSFANCTNDFLTEDLKRYPSSFQVQVSQKLFSLRKILKQTFRRIENSYFVVKKVSTLCTTGAI